MNPCPLEHFVCADGARRHRALGVLHAGRKDIAKPEFDRIEVERLGELVHHHFGRRHALQRAVAARRAGIDRARGNGGGGQIALRQIVDGLRCGGADHGDGWRKILAPAAVGDHVRAEGLDHPALALHRHGVVHAELVPLEAGLELLEAVVRQPHRQPIAIGGGRETIERHVVVIFRAVADRVEWVQIEPLQAEPAFAQHLGRLFRHLLRRLGGHDQMQLLFLGVIPAVGVVRLQRRRVDGLRDIIARQHQPVGRRVIQLFADGVGMEHAFRADTAARCRLWPDRMVLLEGRENHPLGHRREDIVVVCCLATDAHEPGAAPGITLQRPGDRAVADHRIVELQLRFGEAEAGEVVEDQDRNGLPEIGRRLALRQQHVGAVELGEHQAVACQVGGGHDAVWLEVGAEHGNIEAGVQAVGLGDTQRQRMRLSLRPVRHVARSNVARENLFPGHLRRAVDAIAKRPALSVPGRRRQQPLF